HKAITPSDLPAHTISLDAVLAAMRSAETSPNILILDACRDNPFAESSPNDWIPGLAAPTKAPANTLIAFATDPGNVASDGRGTNSPYTSSLLHHLKTPGILADEVFRRVREDLATLMAGQQTPWVNTSLTTPFYFWNPLYLSAKITDSDDDVFV